MTTPHPLIALIDYSSRPTAPQLHALLAQMRPGQVLRAAVIEVIGQLAARPGPAAIYRQGQVSAQAPAPGSPPPAAAAIPQAETVPPQLGSVVRLQIGTMVLTAHSQQPLKTGQQLQVQVARTEPLVELRVLQPQTLITPREALIQAALPRQLQLRDSLPILRELVARPGNTAQSVAQNAPPPATPRSTAGEALPPAARPLLDAIAARPLPPAQLSGAVVRDAMLTSGLFLERALAAGQVPAPDLKLDLLRLLGLLKPMAEARQRVGAEPAGQPIAGDAGRSGAAEGQGLIDRLLRLLDGGLARVQLQQAASLPPEAGGRQTWQFDLPLLIGNQVEEIQVRVERETAEDEAQDPADADSEWRVDLHFEFERLGKVDARLRLRGDTVSALFWCEYPATERMIGAKMPTLEAALKGAGLEIGRMAAMTGTPPDPVELPQPDLGLLDTHA